MDHSNDNIFQVSVKGFCFDKDGKLLMMQDEEGRWDLPGGRVQKGEDLIGCLKRECLEEMGLECSVLDERPAYAWSAADKEGRARMIVGYRIGLKSFEFKPSDECVAIQFFAKEEVRGLPGYPELAKLPDVL